MSDTPKNQSSNHETGREAGFGFHKDDWFLPAIASDGCVRECFLAVNTQLQTRAGFVEALQSVLVMPDQNMDALTGLSTRLKALENTLRFRLGILRPERPAAWFRTPASINSGPFAVSLLMEPILIPYEPNNIESIKLMLLSAWKEQSTELLAREWRTQNLWCSLVELAEGLQKIRVLPEPYSEITLDNPKGIPPVLQSPALIAFLTNVAREIEQIESRLESSFKNLWDACSRLWAYQVTDATTSRSRERVRNYRAEDFRSQMRDRRRQQRAASPDDLRALKCMGFKELPSLTELKERYRGLAKKLHPDLQGGSDVAFKELTVAYSHLSRRCSPRSQFSQ